MILKKDKLVVFEVSNEFEVTEEVAFRNIERGQTESGKWERDDVADYVVKGEKVLNNAMLFKLFEENSDFQIEKVKINELGKTFCYIVSRNSQSKQKDNSSFEEAIRTAVKNQDIKLEVKRGGERYDDLVMRKPLSFLAESDLDWRNQKVILLPFGKSDYFMITHSHKDNAQPEDYSKSMFLEKIKRNAIWNRAIEYVMMQQNSTFRKTREIIEQEYEEVCRLIYDAAVDFDGSY